MPVPFLVKKTHGLRYSSLKSATPFSKFLHWIMLRKAQLVWKKIGPFVQKGKVLDVGMGSGSITYFLKQNGFKVTSVDVAHLSMYEDLHPVIYDGSHLPFKNDEFETAVIIHVLHHCNDGIAVLKETKRVAKRVIFIEDTYRNWFEWLFISISDAVNNGELWFHTYRTVREWRQIAAKNKWKVIHESAWCEWGVAAVYGRYCMFVLE